MDPVCVADVLRSEIVETLELKTITRSETEVLIGRVNQLYEQVKLASMFNEDADDVEDEYEVDEVEDAHGRNSSTPNDGPSTSSVYPADRISIGTQTPPMEIIGNCQKKSGLLLPALSFIQKHMYLCGFTQHTTEDQVFHYVNYKMPGAMITVKKLKTKDDFSSFKLSVSKEAFDEVFCPGFWPEGIHAREWVRFKRFM